MTAQNLEESTKSYFTQIGSVEPELWNMDHLFANMRLQSRKCLMMSVLKSLSNEIFCVISEVDRDELQPHCTGAVTQLM